MLIAFTWPLLAMLALIGAGVAIGRRTRQKNNNSEPTETRNDRPLPDGTLRSGLLASAPFAPVLAALITVIVFEAWDEDEEFVLVAAAAIAVVVNFLIGWACSPFTSVERANSGTFSDFSRRKRELKDRVALLEKQLSSAKTDDDKRRAIALAGVFLSAMDAEENKRDQRWVRASGYNTLWTTLHRAEEALLETESDDRLVAEALHDELRIHGSDIDSTKQNPWLTKIRRAVVNLQPKAKDYLIEQPPGGASNPAPDAQTSRAVVREIRFNLNHYRDSRWDALARARNVLLDTVVIFGVCMYALLVIGILAGLTERQVLAIAVFYGAGVAAGLASQWAVEVRVDRTIEDFGLAFARSARSLVFSGLAALAGLVLVAVIPGVISIDVTPETASAPVATETPAPSPEEPTPSPGEPSPGVGLGVQSAPLQVVVGRSAGFAGGIATPTGTPLRTPTPDAGEPTQSPAPAEAPAETAAPPQDEECPDGSEDAGETGDADTEPTPTASARPSPTDGAQQGSRGSGTVARSGSVQAALDVTAQPTSTVAPTPEASGAATGEQPVDSNQGDMARPLRCVFDLHDFGFDLLIALIFGMSPEALVAILQRQSQKYRAEIKSTEASASAKQVP